jgi:hypothetical protein
MALDIGPIQRLFNLLLEKGIPHGRLGTSAVGQPPRVAVES